MQVHFHLILRGRLDWITVFPRAKYPPSTGLKKNACWLQSPIMKYYMCRIQRQLWNSPALTCLWGFSRTCRRQSCHHTRERSGLQFTEDKELFRQKYLPHSGFSHDRYQSPSFPQSGQVNTLSWCPSSSSNMFCCNYLPLPCPALSEGQEQC